MKSANKLLLLGLVGFFCTATGNAQTQPADSTGLPGDNFSLEGALEMFKTAQSPEEFEKMINTENNKVNNLDLNEDGNIDYVKVIDKKDGDAHAFVLQDAVSETEDQDIAVIELEKSGTSEAVVQIIGDEDIYGQQTIVEPVEQNTQAQPVPSHVVVNVWTWPMVRYVYAPSYAVWASPWGWRARPVWWHPWRPVRWHVFYPYRVPYRNHYVIVHQHRVIRAHRIYTPVRTTSVAVQNRNRTTVNHYRATQTTKSVTVQGRQGRKVQATRKTTTVQGPRGNTATKTTTRVRKKRR